MTVAILALIEHRDAFEAFDRNLRLSHPEDVEQWARDEMRWTADNSAPNPYEAQKSESLLLLPHAKYTDMFMISEDGLAQLRLCVVQEDAATVDNEESNALAHEVSASAFLLAGLELEALR
jgi:hypothetical protein